MTFCIIHCRRTNRNKDEVIVISDSDESVVVQELKSSTGESGSDHIYSGSSSYMFADDRAMRPKKSREERSKDRYGWACLKRLQDDIPTVDITNSALRKLQDEIPSIQKLSLSSFWSMMPCCIICGPHDNSKWKLWNSWFYWNSSTRLCAN